MDADPQTGTLILDSGTRLGRGTTRNEFLLSAEGATAREMTWGDRTSYQFLADAGLLSVVVFFDEQALDAIQLSVLPKELAANWSMETERRRKVANDNWLGERGFDPGQRYEWGSVNSGLDPKGCAAYVFLKYSL